MLAGQWIFARRSDLFFWPFFPRRSFGVARLANLVAAKVVISTSAKIGAPVIPVIPVAQYPTPAMAPRLERNCNQAATFASPIGWRPGTPVVNPFLLLQQLAGAQVF